MTTIKILILAVLFVATSGALFTEYFKNYKVLSLLASFFAIISSYYLFKSIYTDVVNDVVNNIENNRGSEVRKDGVNFVRNIDPKLETPLSTSGIDKPINKSKSLSSVENETSSIQKNSLSTLPKLVVTSTQLQQNPWLTSNLYGSDNRVAALRSVTIEPRGAGFIATIENQFNFQCNITFGSKRAPEFLNNCQSLIGPEPVCNPDMPGSYCAQLSGCFLTANETNPDCFEAWEVKENRVRLRCSKLKTEQVCSGTYTLVRGDYKSKSQFTIARRL